MSNTLPLNLFVDIAGIWQSDKFSNPSALAYLGSGLEVWLNHVLDQLGVKDAPVIKGTVHPSTFITGRVYIAEGAKVEPTAYIQGPCVIGPNAEVRHGAYIRGNAWIGSKAVVGHTTEVKGAVFFDGAKAGHFAYVGDAILGRETNLGAGTKLANLKLKGDVVNIKHPSTGLIISSGLRKLSAIMSDHSQTGCNAVLSPGTLLMQNTAVLPCVHYHGTLLKGMATKSR
jgi:UDP-N-acetylglucosamine diphosphorylase / glucose-1-phosphate thymidylyltransferase / UDP-N-acetylgalactosamine diphosphorylase / glucosamine-1-phosphate N-acetyltransferase / galactosamine-1-phosphate N-acetyltransferase